MSDGANNPSAQFSVVVTAATSNGAPSFSGGLNIYHYVNEGASATYVLPTITDPESDPCSITITGMPTWTSFDAALNIFTFSPPLSSAGNHDVNFNL